MSEKIRYGELTAHSNSLPAQAYSPEYKAAWEWHSPESLRAMCQESATLSAPRQMIPLTALERQLLESWGRMQVKPTWILAFNDPSADYPEAKHWM